MAGCHSVEEIEKLAAYYEAPEREKDYSTVLAGMEKFQFQGNCMYCGHCAPCPQGIDVAGVTRFLNLAVAQGEVPETVREHYGLLAHQAHECIACGACEKRCPFHVAVTENMKKAAELFPHT